MNTEVLKQLRKKSTYPPENWDKLVRIWKNNQPITFYSWECPPRQIIESEKYGRFVNFDIDIKSVVNGKKLDKFTELPRLTTQHGQENWFINLINKNKNAKYIKIVADTNGLYLYKKTREILGERKIIRLGSKFRKLLEEKSKSQLGNNSPEIILYTKLQNKFKKEYELFFKLIYQSFKDKESELVPVSIYNYWLGRMINHIGLTGKDKVQRFDLLKRVVASYAAEGMIFQLLDLYGYLPNPVWANWEESPESAKTTEILRKRYGLSPIPVIYFVKD